MLQLIFTLKMEVLLLNDEEATAILFITELHLFG